MTKKHYEAIAAIIKHHRDNCDISDMAAYEIATGLAYEFEKDNKNFNRTRFLAACGIKE